MLRATLLALAGALAITGAVLLASGVPGPGAYALGLGGVILLGMLFERWRYRANDSRPEVGWQPTGERFEDPHSGKTLHVYYDPCSGERHYVSDSDPPSSAFGP
jgi:hypothetical protein